MVERRTWAVAVGVLAVVLVGAVLYIGPSDFFLPEDATRVDESGPVGENVTVLKTGTFDGKAGHDVSGTVELVRDDDGLFFRFVDYEQEQGPDVFVYVTPSESPTTSGEIRDGTKVRIDGGADGGESTKVGNFVQRLPDRVDAAEIRGVGIWCERFSTPFGAATLVPADAA